MWSTLDSQPEEWLRGDPNLLHTICFCCFRDSASAKYWIHKLVARNQTGRLTKWSEGRGQARQLRRRLQFIEAINRSYEDIDFSVNCVSATEDDMTNFARVYFTQHLDFVTRDRDANSLVFKIAQTNDVIKHSMRRFIMLSWIAHTVKYMHDENQLTGFIFSDWFSGDRPEETEGYRVLGVRTVNGMLKSMGITHQLICS